MKRGCYSFWARTVPEAYTLPSHISMLTGYPPDKHGVTWNEHIEEAYPEVPTIFELAKKAGGTTAGVSGKTKFVVLKKPGTLDWVSIPNDEPNNDLDTASIAAKILREHRPQVLFLHLANTDEAGHADGWGSPAQLAAIARDDQAVGLVFKALDEIGLADHTVVLLTADHGGAGRTHDPDDARSAHIPWIIAGPGIRKNFDLTRVQPLNIHTEDTTATLCTLLGIPFNHEMKGRFVAPIVEGSEPLEDKR
jgi:arylsulfatase A-like enzyme